MTDSVDPADTALRHRRLIGLKLRALVRDHLGAEHIGEPSDFRPGSALQHGQSAWVYLDDRPGMRLGAALAWALRAGADELNVVAESDTGTLARRATAFDVPITVWHADGRSLLPAVPEPLMASDPAPPEHERFRALIVEGGADPLVEHGVLFGEVRGLEVCRVVADPDLGTTRLEVGVGAHDREAFQMLHGDVPPAESLARIASTVAGHRRVGAPGHPLNRIAAERFIRWRIERDPDLVGAVSMHHASPPDPRSNLKEPVPCVAHGIDAAGHNVVAVCSSGVDLDLVPYAADARLAADATTPGAGSGAKLVLATPRRDHVRLTAEIADLLHQPAEFVSID